jgi:hypothetical protein
MVFNHEKEKILKLLDRGADVTIIHHGLSAYLWAQVFRAMPVGSNQELIGKKISDTRDGMIVNYGGVIQLVLPYKDLTCQAIDALDKLVPIREIPRPPMIDFNADMRVDIKMMAAVFGVPERLVDDFTVGYPYSGV